MALTIYNCSAADYETLASDGGELYELAESFEFDDFDYINVRGNDAYSVDELPLARFYNDDRSDDLTLIVGGILPDAPNYTLDWFDSDEYVTILNVDFDTFEAALRAYNAIMQGYTR